ncbi:TonB-dependent receptor [Sulfuricurvum sp.]|uniref:TonB-dependent receptor n=1 Tax=Sulfuricurvum sp. TaxID=2025608 RepID=UPI00260C0155|nr:TonB-dependent receptor [Sulfuricurvum sp.]MDD2267199.1 TonB-dependent receptor plug domain-containing protein [Sulfuricurvum sp.]MDD2782784.1 TonB-dependent receptor plug domain-containing protein [Sulfuricurvum sp.]
MNYSSLALLLIPFSLFAAESEVNSNLFHNLTDDMSTIAQTAKDQRANIDYLPFIMTVFDGEELAHAGASSLKEALSLAAGVNIASDNLSLFNPVFRGSNPVAYGQSKLIVDGIEVNDLFFDGYTAYLSMPIDMIKRIEIVRGPGSYSDGHSGYAGSIVVTTYKGEAPADGVSRWFASAGTYGTKKAGVSYATRDDDFSFAADLYTVHDSLSLTYGLDGLSNNLLGAPNAHLARSGDAPAATDATMLSASLSKGAFFADGRLSTYRHGSGGGINYALASEGDHYNIDQWQIRAGAHYNINSFSGTLQAAVIQDSFTSHQLLAPAGLRLPSLTPPTTIVTYPDGFYGIHEAFIRTYRINNTLAGSLLGGDTTFGISGSWSNVTSEKTITTDRDSGTGMTDYSTTLPFFNPKGSINNLTAYMTYEKVISPSLTGYGSLTIDRRNGISPQVDPRIAAVYAIDPANLIKFSISRAHRNPSWQEMFTLNNKARWGNPDLLPETVMAYETQFIHQFETDHTLSVNLFHLNNNNQIYLQYNTSLARYEYVNGSKSTIQGIEGEWRKRYDATTFYAAYTHIWAEDGNGVTLANAPSDTARGFITHSLNENWFGSLAGRWQNKIPRAATDTRNDMKAIGIVDTSIGYKLPYLNSEIQFTLKNIFDEKELYPSPPNTYDGDYPSTGRAFMATLRGTF